MNKEVAKWLRNNIHMLKKGDGENLYKQFAWDFKMYSQSYLTDELLEILSVDEIFSLFKNSIPRNAFRFIELEEINIPNHIIFLEPDAFNSSHVKHVSMPSTSGNENAFRDCEELYSVEIRSGHNKTGNRMFSSCTSLVEANIDTNTIEENTFAGCSRLEYVHLGKNVCMIKNDAFRSCPSLKEIVYDGTKEDWENVDCLNFWRANSSIEKIVCSDGEVWL